MRKISNTQYNILKELEVNESIEEDEMDTDFMTQEKQIRTLINTISKDSDESTDLFANLRETKEEQTFYTGSASLEKVDFDEEEEEEEKGNKDGLALTIIAILSLIIAVGVFVWFKFFS